MTVARITQDAIEVVRSGTPKASVTQVAIEVIRIGSQTSRITQVAIEVIRANNASQLAVSRRRPQVNIIS